MMRSSFEPPVLTSWQQDFVSSFISHKSRKSLLIAQPGAGKTVTSLFAAKELMNRGLVDALIAITSVAALREQWKRAAQAHGLDLGTTPLGALGRHGVAATVNSIEDEAFKTAISNDQARRWLFVADDTDAKNSSLEVFADRLLALNPESRALFIGRHAPSNLNVEAEFSFQSEFFLDKRILDSADTEIRIARFSPSFPILRALQRQGADLDALSWRQFEKLISELLERDGYSVELMQGSKDGGVDVVAIKDLGEHGFYKSIWQAKKQRTNNKVGIAVVRELADTRQELKATKAIIVTSSFLTQGALSRIERDRHLLGKVDRDDLAAWINRTLRGEG